MQQKQDHDKRHYNHFFNQLIFYIADGCLDQFGPVICHFKLYTFRQSFLYIRHFLFHVFNHLLAFSPYRITTIPPTTSPSPFSSNMPSRRSPPICTEPISFTRTGIPLLLPTAILS